MSRTIIRSRAALGLPENSIILSFDDGPVGDGVTESLLDLLAEEQIQAAFCLVGRRVFGNEETVQRIHRDGHLIANHGMLHLYPGKLDSFDFEREVLNFDKTVATALGIRDWKSSHYRPPGGMWSPKLDDEISRLDKQLLPLSFFAWDFIPIPFQKTILRKALLRDARKNRGGLYLLHEAAVPLSGESLPPKARIGRRWLTELVHEFIHEAREKGFEFLSPEAFKKLGSSQ